MSNILIANAQTNCNLPRRQRLVTAVLCLATAGALLAAPLAPCSAQRVKAPELVGGTDYFGTTKPFGLKDLRGKIVVLDFWTFC